MTRILTLTLLTLTLASIQGRSQTYTVSSSTNYSALSPNANWCTGCVFNISTGVTLTVDDATGCTNCTFNGGNVSVTNSFSFNGGTFNGSTVTISTASNYYTSTTSGPTFKNGSLFINAAVTCQACTFTNESVQVNIPSGSTLTLQSSGGFNNTTFTNSTLSMTAGGKVHFNSNTSLTNSSITLNGNAVTDDTGPITMSGSQLYMYGNTSMTPVAGPIALSNTSTIFVGDGSNGSTAYLNMNSVGSNNLQLDATSLVKIANGNNYYYNSGTYQYTNASGTSSSVSTASNTISCNHGAVTGHDNSCALNYVYGCATMSSSAVACTILATADMNLSATVSGNNVVLDFTDGDPATADHYVIERSTGGDWTTIATLNAGGYSTGEFHYTDANPPAGDCQYRIERTDRNGKTLYSTVSTVTIARAAEEIGIHPNPATGGTFYITTPYTDEMILNVYTITGQLITRNSLKGQTQYAIHLPAASLSPGTVVVQTISQAGTRSFTVLVR